MLMLLYSLNKKKVPKKFIWSWQHAHRHAMILVAQRRLLDLISVPIGMPWPLQVKMVNKISQHFYNIFLVVVGSILIFYYFILTYELLTTQLL